MYKNLFKFIFLSGLIGLSANANAQVVSLPNLIDPALINKDLKTPSNLIKTAPVPSQYDINTETIENTKPAILSSVTFELKKIEYSGNDVINQEEFNKFIIEYLNREVSLSDIQNIADEITNLYKQNGYLTTIAYIPPQKIQNGTVQINIEEGKIGYIKVQGNRWIRQKYIKNNILKPNNLTESKVFNVNDLKKSLNALNSSDYIKGSVTIEKGTQNSTTDIILDIKDNFPLSINAGWNNAGRNYIGNNRFVVGTEYGSLTGNGDRLFIGNTLAKGTCGVDTLYSLPLGNKGTKLNLGYSFSNISMGGIYKPYEVKGNSHIFKTEVFKPLYKNADTEVSSSISFDFLSSKTTMYSETILDNYDTRVIRLGLNGKKFTENGIWLGDFNVSTGIPLLGATVYRNSSLPDGNFVKIDSSLSRYLYLPQNILGVFRVSGLFSPMNLLSSEQMHLGGNSTVRGFNESILSGDYGYNLSAELRMPIPFLPEKITVPYLKNKKTKLSFGNDIKFILFYDQGWANEIHQNVNSSYRNFLQSVGVGLRYNLGHFSAFTMNVGVPLGRKRYDEQNNVKFHFNLQSNIF